MSKIVIVDDEVDVIDLVAFILEREGHEVMSATNGTDGLALIRRELPDLAILDVMMPGMDGYSVNSRLCEEDATRAIPVVILTAKGKVEELFKMSPNVKGYLHKPFNPAEFKDAVSAILEKKKL